MVLLKRKKGTFDVVKSFGNSERSYVFFLEDKAVRACQIANQQFGDFSPYEVVEVAIYIAQPKIHD